MGLTTREIGSSSFNDMISSIDRRSEFVENRAGANVTTNNALISYGLSNSCSILNAPCGYSNGVYPSLRPIQTFGSELVTNGTFDTDSDWNKNANWSISGGTANCDGTSNNDINQGLNLFTPILGKTYKISIKINSISQGGIRVSLGGSVTNYYTAIGIYTYNLTTISTDRLRIQLQNSAIGSIDNVSVKEVISADFDFTRGSSATRVNELGLVEDVQILSSNLVQNGDFSQEGSEQITNGDFENGSTGWNLDGSCTIELGKANFLSSTSNAPLYQSSPYFTIGKTYKITYTVSNYSAGRIIWNDFGAGAGNGIIRTANGTYTEYYVKVGTSTNFGFQTTFGFTGSIDNVSVKEVGQDWDFGTGWSIGDGKVYFDNPTGTELYQSLSTTASKYRISFDLDITSGTIQTSFSSPSTSTIKSFTTSGTKTVDITTTASFSRFRFVGLGGSVFNIDNISLIEINDSTDLPRINYTNFDYENGVVVPYSGEGSLLLEPQSTNLITYSEDFSQSDWSKTNISITTNSAISPDGTINASLLTENSSNAQHFIGDALTLTSGTSYSVSVYAKKKERSVLQISPSSSHIASSYANYDLDLGVVSATGGSVTAEIEYLSNDWYRCILKFTATNTATASLAFFIQTSTTALRGVSYQGDGTSGLYLWGAQVEAQSFATSYIPTNGSTVTRLADVCNNAGSSDLINSTEGVLYAEIAALADDLTNKFISISNGSKTERVEIGYSNVSNKIFALSYVGNVNQCNIGFVLPNMLDYNKIAISYAENNFALWVNGVKVGVDLIGSVSAQNTLNELAFDEGDGTDIFYSKTKCVAVFKEALTDEELTCLTTI